jgi:predicted kinase
VKLIVLAGLPGTGKSALARELAALLDCPVLDKDRLRAELYGEAVEYAREQDDRVVAQLLERARGLDAPCAILDGRCWTRRADVQALLGFARGAGIELAWIECTCAPSLARERLERDARAGAHPAANRGPELHQRLAQEAEPLEVPRIVLDSGAATPAELARGVLRELGPTE